MKMATAETLEPQTAVEIGVEEWLQPRHWGAPADISIKRVSEPLGVMSTEKGLEEYRRNKMEQKRVSQPQLNPYRVLLASIYCCYNVLRVLRTTFWTKM